MGYELVVVWDDGSRDVWDYDTWEEAAQAVENLMSVRCKQIAWYESRRKDPHYVEKRLGQEDM